MVIRRINTTAYASHSIALLVRSGTADYCNQVVPFSTRIFGVRTFPTFECNKHPWAQTINKCLQDPKRSHKARWAHYVKTAHSYLKRALHLKLVTGSPCDWRVVNMLYWCAVRTPLSNRSHVKLLHTVKWGMQLRTMHPKWESHGLQSNRRSSGCGDPINMWAAISQVLEWIRAIWSIPHEHSFAQRLLIM